VLVVLDALVVEYKLPIGVDDGESKVRILVCGVVLIAYRHNAMIVVKSKVVELSIGSISKGEVPKVISLRVESA
jgi:hypothetical protein